MPRIIFNLRPNDKLASLVKKSKTSARAADRAAEAAHVDAYKLGHLLKYSDPAGTDIACAKIVLVVEKLMEARSALAAAHHELDQLSRMAKG